MNTIKIANKEEPWKTKNQDVEEDEHNQGHKLIRTKRNQEEPRGTKSQEKLKWTKSEELGIEKNEHDQDHDVRDWGF
jgi:hypothetical protein